MRRCAASVVVLFLAVASLTAQRGPAPLEAVALVNASVINVRTGAVQRAATVVLRGGRIESVGAVQVLRPPTSARSICAIATWCPD